MSGDPLQPMIHSADERLRPRPLPHPRHCSVEDGSDQSGGSDHGISDDVRRGSLPKGAHGAMLLLVTFLNAVVAVTVSADRPTRWDAIKIMLRDTWNATGYAAWCLVLAWIILRLFVTNRFNRLMRIGLAISAIHAVFWLMSPSWS